MLVKYLGLSRLKPYFRRRGRSRRSRRGDSASSRGSYKDDPRKSGRNHGISTYEDRSLNTSRQGHRRKKKRHRRLEEKSEEDFDGCLPQITKGYANYGQETPRQDAIKVSHPHLDALPNVRL